MPAGDERIGLAERSASVWIIGCGLVTTSVRKEGRKEGPLGDAVWRARDGLWLLCWRVMCVSTGAYWVVSTWRLSVERGLFGMRESGFGFGAGTVVTVVWSSASLGLARLIRAGCGLGGELRKRHWIDRGKGCSGVRETGAGLDGN